MLLSNKTILLTGAPWSKSLAWGSDDLSDELLPCFSTDPRPRNSDIQHQAKTAPQWRSLTLEKSHWPTGLTQPSRQMEPWPEYGAANETSFLSPSILSLVSVETTEHPSQTSMPSDSIVEEVMSQYYEHSFAVHEDVPSSNIVGPGSANASINESPDGSSFESSINTDVGSEEQVARARLHSGQLSNLKDVPNAGYLRSINPQTMTLNLVVGIISISQPRLIKPRKGGREVELVEMLVGDETRAGFGINIWLPLPRAQESHRSNHGDLGADSLRTQTLCLRPQDIVLAKTVALTSFRGKVYGQSLRKGMTTLDLLHRNVVDVVDRRGAYKAKELDDRGPSDVHVCKAKKVKDWVMHFVRKGSGEEQAGNGIRKGARRVHLPSLPQDTQ